MQTRNYRMQTLNCKRKKGFMSIWFGNFREEQAFWHYLATIHCAYEEEQYDPANSLRERDFKIVRKKLFLEKNAGRPFENTLKEIFDESFNRFIYDFGVSFDQDFQEAGFIAEPSKEIDVVLDEWADDDLIQEVKALVGETLPKEYSCFFAIPSCIYNGIVKRCAAKDYEMDFLGVIEEDFYSDVTAEKYNGLAKG